MVNVEEGEQGAKVVRAGWVIEELAVSLAPHDHHHHHTHHKSYTHHHYHHHPIPARCSVAVQPMTSSSQTTHDLPFSCFWIFECRLVLISNEKAKPQMLSRSLLRSLYFAPVFTS